MTSAIDAFSFKINRFWACDILNICMSRGGRMTSIWTVYIVHIKKFIFNSMIVLNRIGTDAISADKIAISKWLCNETTFERIWDIFKNKTFLFSTLFNSNIFVNVQNSNESIRIFLCRYSVFSIQVIWQEICSLEWFTNHKSKGIRHEFVHSFGNTMFTMNRMMTSPFQGMIMVEIEIMINWKKLENWKINSIYPKSIFICWINPQPTFSHYR